MSAGDEALAAEALRLFRRYQREIVESLHLCPWAERARLEGQVSERVILSDELDTAPVLDAIQLLAAQPRCEIGIVLLPRVRVTPTELERFVSALATEDAARRELGTAPFAMAAFHPEGKLDDADPERLVPFLRRTPDPTIQLVRQSSLERVREGFNEGTAFVDLRALSTLDLTRDDTLPLRERIARANHRTVKRLGASEVQARLDAILRDRDATYERLGEPRRQR